ncbi:hypothetical protein EYF80_010203 [Liparis tanakae]|uniref:Uncharacterized protein n=1 Tax=Liparis tanakae TaxID=230148 RepID=A0A4Z2IP67_9TELE|nr:hypothetical protein EYF80_010203 [Liparis tanakae]
MDFTVWLCTEERLKLYSCPLSVLMARVSSAGLMHMVSISWHSAERQTVPGPKEHAKPLESPDSNTSSLPLSVPAIARSPDAQGPLRVAQQLEHAAPAHAQLRVAVRAEADLVGTSRDGVGARRMHACAVACIDTWRAADSPGVARTFCFSQSHKISIPSGPPVWPTRYLESGENATHINSDATASPAVRTFLLRPCSCCRSNTVTVAVSAHSDAAR